MNTLTRRVLIGALALGAIFGAPRAMRLLPLATTENVGPERVVLLHGLGRTRLAMVLLEGELRAAGYETYSIGYASMTLAPEEILKDVSAKVAACCEASDRPVHFVGHSLGGLMVRALLAEQRPAALGRVVLLGAPNGGSELADADRHGTLTAPFLEHAGPSARALGTGPEDFAARLPVPDFEVGVIAGTRGTPLGDQWLPKPNDGLVSVESARLEGMTDFRVYPLSHWRLRSDPEVAAEVVHFLREGRFLPES